MKDLSMLLEKISEKYPDDKDVMMAMDAYDAEMGGEEEMPMDDMEMGMEEEMPAEEGAPSFDELFAEDMADEEDEDMPKKKKKPKPGVDEPSEILGSI